MKRNTHIKRWGIILTVTVLTYGMYIIQDTIKPGGLMANVFSLQGSPSTNNEVIVPAAFNYFSEGNEEALVERYRMRSGIEKSSYLLIPALEIVAPIQEPEFHNELEVERVLHQGVVRDLVSAPVGLLGNTVIFGHSSDEISSDFSEIFKDLPNIEEDHNVYVVEKGTKYSYGVKNTDVVAPDDGSIISASKTGQSELTLYTCYPVGTTDKRFVVKANLL